MLSLAMIVKNESEKIGRCLQSVRSIVDEIVVVDTGSTDNTKQIASSFGARIFDFSWGDDFSAARNYALEQCNGDWILVLDADDRITKASREEIDDFICNNDAIGRIRITNSFDFDGELRESQANVTRLFPKGSFYTGKIHEQIVSDLPRKNAPIEVYHDGYFKSEKYKRNIRMLEVELEQNPNDPYILYQLGKEYRIIKEYVKAEMFLTRCYKAISNNDGYKPQLVIEYLYTILGLKDFEQGLNLIEEESHYLSDFSDFHFVSGLFYMELVFSNTHKYFKYFPLIEESYLKCLSIGDTDKYESVRGTGSFLAAYNLAVYYETTGDLGKARTYYGISVEYNYMLAQQRLGIINKTKGLT
ncbi:tetratricopeptide repeat-containing glycosyltransferase family 2 protein [Paenibacillus pedocola]|uniref:tetratricopeptide repeat-containing glycosyltransferase family 2 protein n=1 Tax=Paenibacillus pedocola TaxID=3242193 RepID=UPI0028775863|nr:glycosyltransferase family 2 protein [Paenibacillus typhae]